MKLRKMKQQKLEATHKQELAHSSVSKQKEEEAKAAFQTNYNYTQQDHKNLKDKH